MLYELLHLHPISPPSPSLSPPSPSPHCLRSSSHSISIPPPPFFSPTHLSLYHTETSGSMPYGKVPTSSPQSKDNTQMSKQCTQFTTVPTPSVLANPLRRHRRPLQTPGKKYAQALRSPTDGKHPAGRKTVGHTCKDRLASDRLASGNHSSPQSQ